MAKNFCHEVYNKKEDFDRRSFRTVVQGDHRVLVGCPVGEWQPRKQHCKVGMKAHELLHPMDCKHAKKCKSKKMTFKSKGWPFDGVEDVEGSDSMSTKDKLMLAMYGGLLLVNTTMLALHIYRTRKGL